MKSAYIYGRSDLQTAVNRAWAGGQLAVVKVKARRRWWLFGPWVVKATYRMLILCLLAVPCWGDVLGIWCAPEDDCTAAIVAEIGKATKSIKYSMYNFTSPPIADALIRAHGRGVKVTLLLDKRAQVTQYSQAARCKAAGIEVRLDGKHPIHHVKERIIDDKRVLFGSFNDSRQANRNREDLVLDDTPKLVKRFADEFAKHLKHAEPL